MVGIHLKPFGLSGIGWKLSDCSVMTIRDNIRAWLVERAGNAYCAECITDSMNLFDLGYVRDVTRFLAANSKRFHRFTGVCVRCGKAQLVIRAAEQLASD